MAKTKRSAFSAKLAKWRIWIQASFLLVWLDPMALRMHTVCSPVFHCYSCPLATFACPIGVLANFSALHLFPYLAIGTLLVVGGLLGTFICGWVCPFGFLQDLVAKIPTPKFELPSWCGYLRYAVLIGLVFLVPYLWGEGHPLFICSVCPAGAIEAAIPNTVNTAIDGNIVLPSTLKLTILGLFLVAILFARRPWCVLFCPLGAIYSFCNHFSFFYLKFDRHECNECGLCNTLCKYGGPSASRTGDQRCIRCLDCTQCSSITVDCSLRQNGDAASEELVQIGESDE